MTRARYGIYYSPYPETDLWLFGSRWLGRDSATGGPLKRLAVRSVSAQRVREITAETAQHGFHATLKAPFYLARGCDRQMLDEALEAFAAAHEPIDLAPLELTQDGGFIALQPCRESPEGNKLAAECVRAFDHFRHRSTPQNKTQMTSPQPPAGDRFRFHMPLTGRLDGVERQAVLADLKAHAKGVLGQPLKLDVLTLLRQNSPDDAFEVVKCYRFNRLARLRWPRQKQPPLSVNPNRCRSTERRRP